ncbi:response regulator transcription factor [Acinetobacter boissieri]|uniref:Regulatory protein, luxR family n=1 Tax=Acinetobacter boissieri TaxID=1219383 RepID=A0A1G6HKB7_9GAMM|nr:helix-turn-helix transcriptional regulator [Acinetobacter boissieri]SDB94603.1 regulatory protein, luxR family [Acinetobacter boissieri]
MTGNNWNSFVDHFLTGIGKSVPFTKFFAYETDINQSELNWFNYQNIPAQAMDIYLNKMCKYDPVFFKNNLDNTEEIILLNTKTITPRYQSFLKNIHVIDNVELVFKTSNQTIKGISLIRGENERHFSDHELMTIQSCHAIAKHSLDCIRLEPQPQNIGLNSPTDCLTNKEKKVLSLLLEGKKNQDIANLLFISLATVKTHIQHIFKKMFVKSKFELMSKYYHLDYKI